MNYYIETKIKDYSEITQLINLLHMSGGGLAFYFDNINTTRIFSEDKKGLEIFKLEILEVPNHSKFVSCSRVRAIEKTDRQREKRQKRFIEHLAKKGIEYDDSKVPKKLDKSHDYYVNIKSLSNGSSFRLYVKNKIKKASKQGGYTSYGLSLNGSTIPLF
jgi:CRISPR-associated endoribonuclease Cas6/Csy4 subtype I-F